MNIRKCIGFLLAVTVFFGLLTFPAAAAGPETADIVDPYKLYTYEQMLADLDTLNATYPQLLSVSSIGKSVEGRDIPVFTLGTGKREILICASMHAREYIATNLVMYMVDRYCQSYVKDENYYGLSYRTLLDSVRFVIVPMLNPDGVIIAQNGIETLEHKDKLLEMEISDSKHNGYFGWKANANGVDLNHNWPYNWTEDEDVKAPASANYNGTGPCTEPEVIAMKKLIDSTPFYMLCSFHTSGKAIYWIDTSNSPEMYKEFYPIIRRIANWIGYSALGYEDVSEFGGYMVNYARGVYQKPAFTVELCPFFDIYPYKNYYNFIYTVNAVLPIGLLMAEAVMKMEPDAEAIDLTVDDELVIFTDVRPVISNSRTLVPLRTACESVGLQVEWDGELQLVTITDGTKTVELTIDSNVMKVDDEELVLDTAPCLINDRTMVPIRAIMEAFGYHVDWNDASRTVIIQSPPVEDTPEPPADAEDRTELESPSAEGDDAETEIPAAEEEDSSVEVSPTESPDIVAVQEDVAVA